MILKLLVIALVLLDINKLNASDACAEGDIECHEKAKYKKGKFKLTPLF